MSEVTGRVAVVTGGTRGIGQAIAAALVSRGADVVATGRTASGFDAARAAIRELEARRRSEGRPAGAGRFECVEMDVRDYAQVERALAKAAELFGGIDILVNNAGMGTFCEEHIRASCIMPGSVRTEFAGTHQGAGSEWKLDPDDVARVVADLLEHDPRSLPSRVEIRPSKPDR